MRDDLKGLIHQWQGGWTMSPPAAILPEATREYEGAWESDLQSSKGYFYPKIFNHPLHQPLMALCLDRFTTSLVIT